MLCCYLWCCRTPCRRDLGHSTRTDLNSFFLSRPFFPMAMETALFQPYSSPSLLWEFTPPLSLHFPLRLLIFPDH
ncbi:hypothetical protein EI94DRAFT_1721822 [Lactarius quietus]|nr:hypothetical protein EI94DRAFT_1721822 [Lactarius quietus]